MKPLFFTSVLLVAITAVGQNQPSTRSSSQGGQASNQVEANSGLCYAIRTFTVGGDVEQLQQLQPYRTAPRTTTCTPANRFRAKYIPNLTRIPDVSRARCPNCSTVPITLK